MDPRWYSIRLVVTVVMSFIGASLLYVAHLVGNSIAGSAVALLVLLGLALPSGFYAVFTLVGWQRGAAGGAVPNALIVWCIERRIIPFVPVAFGLLLFGVAQLMISEIGQGDADRAAAEAYRQTVRRSVGDACYSHAGQAIGADLADVALKSRVPNFCTCLDLEVEKNYTPEQFAEVPKDRWWAAGDAKTDRIVQKCRLDDSSLVRATRAIRKNGGDPDSDAMRSKILDYSACVKVELESGYSDAGLMKVSADPAWQDADPKFQQIIGRCLKYAGL